MTDGTNEDEPFARRKLSSAFKAAKARNNHIKRLQERNRELAEALAEERILRKKAWSYYNRRITSKFWFIFSIYEIYTHKK